MKIEKTSTGFSTLFYAGFRKTALLASSAILISACASTNSLTPAQSAENALALLGADSIYFGGDIITINDAQPSAEAVAVNGGKIVAVGTRAEIEKTQRGSKTKMIDLAGKTLLPGFVDAHSHFTAVGMQASSANLLPLPDGPVNTIAQLQQVMREFIAKSPVVKAHGVAVGFNYDDSQLKERRHPTRQELDAISKDIPIMVIHQSGHLGVLNSKALANMKITAKSVNPAGGMIRREADRKTPNGVLEENAFFGIVYKMVPALTAAETVAQIQASEAIYLANGFTTIQDGKTDLATLKALPEMAVAGSFKADIVSYADIAAMGDDPILHSSWMSSNYRNHFRIAGVKLTYDGSPQGKTAWFTEPYFKVPAGQKKSYAGYAAFSDAEALKWYTLATQNNWQMLNHANGDAAIDQLIKTVTAVQTAAPGKDRRGVLIHGQYLRADQIPALQRLGIFPSLYPMHTFYWGDWHRESVAGAKRAEFISPTGAVLARGMKFSIHSDAPVTFPNSMRLLDSAVNRTTRSGYVLGADQRVEPLVALKAMTLWPAYQHFEEASKGSIELGKLADLVILSANPLKVERAKLIDLKVLETIKEGQPVYRAAAK
ncbi:amidohydrolase [Undibacterium parvum]|uniref:Amidohydrolase n=1 Tax=Undibacterium parvum TaxID=401471 RepID=A0A3Q9BMY9_9BURK|nr:amidohydrolase [Undibacterium parvum]AZP10699.1 amidohydrolase [Undibacterium parvum]